MVKGKDGADYEIISADNAGYMCYSYRFRIRGLRRGHWFAVKATGIGKDRVHKPERQRIKGTFEGAALRRRRVRRAYSELFPPCGWKTGARGFHLSSWICTIKSVACQTIPHLFFSINKTRSTQLNFKLCAPGFIAWIGVHKNVQKFMSVFAIKGCIPFVRGLFLFSR